MNWLFCIKYILKIAITLAVRVFSCLWDVLPLPLQGGSERGGKGTQRSFSERQSPGLWSEVVGPPENHLQESTWEANWDRFPF